MIYGIYFFSFLFLIILRCAVELPLTRTNTHTRTHTEKRKQDQSLPRVRGAGTENYVHAAAPQYVHDNMNRWGAVSVVSLIGILVCLFYYFVFFTHLAFCCRIVLNFV